MAKSPLWQRKAGRSPNGASLNARGRAAYNRANGANLKPPAPNPKNEADAARRKSFCARSKGQLKMHGIDCSKDPKKRACIARRNWNC